ncbi:MAG: hypothetical protein KGL44_04110, partial [Sphingomonadales bacterium]|nr:hypothetical protein [Sphingomonadales bacterium]
VRQAGAPAAVADEAGLVTRTIVRDGKTIVLKTSKPLTDAEAEADRIFAALPPETPTPPADPVHRERRVMIVTTDSNGPTVTAGGLDGQAMACSDGSQQVGADASEDKGDGHRQSVRIRTCVDGGSKAAAIDGIRRAKERIAADAKMSPGLKQQVLQQLDAEIERLSRQG